MIVKGVADSQISYGCFKTIADVAWSTVSIKKLG